MNCASVPVEKLKGSLTYHGLEALDPLAVNGYEDAKTQHDTQSNRWSVTEYSRIYARSSHFGNGYFYYNSKCYSFRVRPVVAFCFAL